MIKYITILTITIFSLMGCNQNILTPAKKDTSKQKVQLTLNDAVISLAKQLSKNNHITDSDTGTMTLTSFVNLSQLNKTSQLGRVLGESLYSELFIRGFNVTDFRGQNVISINNNGEFYITRNITKLQSEVPNTYILVGTYSKIDQNIMINARVLDNKTGKIVSSARVLYANDDCSIFGICNNAQRKIKIVGNNIKKNNIALHSTKPKKIMF